MDRALLIVEPRAKKSKHFITCLEDFEELIREHLGEDAGDYFKDVCKELRQYRNDWRGEYDQ